MNREVVVFASWSKDWWGSWFANLHKSNMWFKIAGVISNHEQGGVRQNADALWVRFEHMKAPFTGDRYKAIVDKVSKDAVVALSGWLKPVEGLNPTLTINIHPWPVFDNITPELEGLRFAWAGMYGHHVHEAIHSAYQKGLIKRTCVTMHFVTAEYDKGPIIFQIPVEITDDDTPNTIAGKVNKIEHQWQPYVTQLVVNWDISWDWKDPRTLKFPDWYQFNHIVSLN